MQLASTQGVLLKNTDAFGTCMLDYMHIHPLQQNKLTYDTQPSHERATFILIDESSEGQRLDNFLLKLCKGVPKSHIHRVIRAGEVRINKGRTDAQYRLVPGDVVRVPPLRTAVRSESGREPSATPIELPVLYEDEGMLVVNKPAGLAVHGGSGVSFGVVERLRAARPDIQKSLELVHRLDRGTSGILVLSKKRRYLSDLQEQLRARSWRKFYTCLVSGQWPKGLNEVKLPLLKTTTEHGEKKVYVHPEGQTAFTKFRALRAYHTDFSGEATLLQAEIMTGRTHQIRVHCAAKGHAILGDDQYGDFSINKLAAKNGLPRMFLHATRLQLKHPDSGETLTIECPLPDVLDEFLKKWPSDAI